MKPKFRIGIIGGAGPAASALFYQMLIQECQIRYGSVEDQDFPLIFLINYPFSPMVEKEASSALQFNLTQELQFCFDTLHSLEAERIAIACNTLHTYLESVMIKQNTFFSIKEAVQKRLNKTGTKRILIIGTERTLDSHLYSDVARNVLSPSAFFQKRLTQVIQKILTGQFDENDSQNLKNDLEEEYQRSSFDSAILGCTEFSVLHHTHPIKSSHFSVVDPLSLLAQSILTR